ncbi:MAG TPA: hypothetical protein VNU68_34940 [Verrucomicrobiae bacterium]|nr:hypothetical protein [Verrucomicrobiae bacterium]
MPWSIAGGAIGSVLVGGGTITTPSTPQWMGVAQRYNAEQQQQAYLQALAIQQYLGQGIDQGLGQSVLQPWQQPGYQGLEVAPTQAEAVPAEPPPPGKRELDLDQIREVEAPKIVAREIEL